MQSLGAGLSAKPALNKTAAAVLSVAEIIAPVLEVANLAHRIACFGALVARNQTGETTANLRAVLEALARDGLKSVVTTGSVFEQYEGAGEMPLVAFSAYGLSKGLTAKVVRRRCREVGLRYGKFGVRTRREFRGFDTGSQGH